MLVRRIVPVRRLPSWVGWSFVIRHSSLALLLAAGAAGCYCTFWESEGHGPLPKDKAYEFLGRAPKRLSPERKQEAEQLMQRIQWDDVPKEFFGVGKNTITYKSESKKSYWTTLLVGYLPWQTGAMLKKRDATARAYGRFQGWAPGYPVPVLWWQASEIWYSLDTGEEISSRSRWGLGPGGVLGGSARGVLPAEGPAFLALQGESFPYNARRGWYVLGGLVAGGTVNGQRYLQLAWFPIPR